MCMKMPGKNKLSFFLFFKEASLLRYLKMFVYHGNL